MTIRHPDWPTRLTNLVEARRRTPFAWGLNDCALFATDCVREMTGVDFGATYRGTYSDALGAMNCLPAGGVEALATLALGEPKRASLAGRGDVVLLVVTHEGLILDPTAALNPEVKSRPALGVCLGEIICATGPAGLSFAPRDRIVWAWTV
jgi:hypothetical protein